MNVWKEWAHRCTQLREIEFRNSLNNPFEFDEQTLETIFKIPTLQTVNINSSTIPFFPRGPSNIRELNIMHVKHDSGYKFDIESYSKNFCTHTNLKFLRIEKFKEFFN